MNDANRYIVNEMFLAPQGEGVRAGVVHVFVRFTACNLRCAADGPEGFDCDTEFTSGRSLSGDEIVAEVLALAGSCRWVLFTGGEPLLQLDSSLIDRCHEAGLRVAVETNGTRPLPPRSIDWLAVSPKTAEHTLRIKDADEVRYVRRYGQAIPEPAIEARHRLISVASGHGGFDPRDVEWCVGLCRDNPEWRLSVQFHKLWRVR